MSRNKYDSDVEALRRLLKQKEQQIKRLERQVKSLIRYSQEHKEDDEEELEVKVEVSRFVEKKCEECGKGRLSVEKMGVRWLKKCSVCSFSRFYKNPPK